MQRIYCIILIIFGFVNVFAQLQNDAITEKVNRVDSVLQLIYQYETFGPKPVGSPALDSTKNWIISKYQEYGYDVNLDTFYKWDYKCHNIIIEKPGLDSNKWIIVGAHYDSDNTSPGANDNGSGVIACLQIAKNIKNVETQIGIRIINFSAEETGYNGSAFYVQGLGGVQDEIQLMLNLDQLGGTYGADNSKIVCERDEDNSPSINNAKSFAKTDTLANIIELYTNLTPVISYANRSDYVTFQDSGYVITGLYQESNYSHYHKSTDITANMDIDATTEVIKGALAATLHFSRITEKASVSRVNQSNSLIYPNPANHDFMVKSGKNELTYVRIMNHLGQVVLTGQYYTNEKVSVSHLSDGVYLVRISTSNNEILSNSKLIIAH